MIKTEFNQFLLYYQNKSHFFMTFYNNQNTIGIFAESLDTQEMK